MTNKEEALKRRARWAYELGRLISAWRYLWIPPLFMLMVPQPSCRPTTLVFGGIALFITTIMLAWRGGIAERAILPTSAAGLLPLATPLACGMFGSGATILVVLCGVGGLLGGAMVAWWIRRQGGVSLTALSIIVLHTGLVGLLGCATFGLGAAVGMALGVLIGAVPALGPVLSPHRA